MNALKVQQAGGGIVDMTSAAGQASKAATGVNTGVRNAATRPSAVRPALGLEEQRPNLALLRRMNRTSVGSWTKLGASN
jgi:hypothetical protein